MLRPFFYLHLYGRSIYFLLNTTKKKSKLEENKYK